MQNPSNTPTRIDSAIQAIGKRRSLMNDPRVDCLDSIQRAIGIISVVSSLESLRAFHQGPDIESQNNHDALSSAVMELEDALAFIEAAKLGGGVSHE